MIMVISMRKNLLAIVLLVGRKSEENMTLKCNRCGKFGDGISYNDGLNNICNEMVCGDCLGKVRRAK